ncbi:MAG: glycogen synthase [Polyangiaceae bacterium]|nr:glycogen synthase [Polyangiaceae bacterium]
MDILMVSSEVSPIAKVGGLADAVAALAKTLSRLGHKITLAMPRYRADESSGAMLARRLTPLRLPVSRAGGAPLEATLYDGRLGSAVELVLIDVPGLFDRPAATDVGGAEQPPEAGHAAARGVYGSEGEGDPEEVFRFGVFARAAAELALRRSAGGKPFDVVHAHDWPAALVPYFLRGKGVRRVLTVHNGAFQGVAPRETALELGIDAADFHPGLGEFYGKLNCLKLGALSADVVTTVSPTYARELATAARGHGLDGVFAGFGDRLVGITNGVDYAVWSPATDPYLPARYDAEEPSNKGRCKATLCNELELAVDPDRPLLVALGRVDAQKGSDLLASALPRLTQAGCQVVVAGTGDPALVQALTDAVRGEPGARYLGGVSEPMSHRLLAAADAVLVPSRHEPCGLVQQYGQRYGAPPIAHAVGGLCDTIVDCDAGLATGTGFLFEEPSTTALVGAVERALSAMRTPRWAALRRRTMRLDLSWERPARRYAKLYAERPAT